MMRTDSVFLKACRREPVPYTPVWIMRQAGRYMKSYRDIRSKVSFMELCKNKELASEVTVRAAEQLGVDAAIIFSDILLIAEPMGLKLEYDTPQGPAIRGGISTKEQVDRIPEVRPEETLAFVADAVRLTRARLKPDLPLIGFCGAPFTLGAYLIEGGGSKQFVRTKQWIKDDAGAWHALMEKLVRGLAGYLKMQVAAGADALQIFDSWAGCLSPQEYRDYALPHSQALIRAVGNKVPIIYFGTGTAPFLKEFASAGADVIGVDSQIGLNAAWDIIGPQKAIQGNLDPQILFSTPELIEQEVKKILDQADGRPGHIFNLGHGILPATPEENASALVEIVHRLSRTASGK